MNGLVIEDSPASGVWNMAKDQALADFAAKHQWAILRFYRWIEPTLSLGYFQEATQRTSDDRLDALPWVRRATGGGAILHHHELTYSVFLPMQAGKGHAPELYEILHQPVINRLRQLHLKASFWRECNQKVGSACQSQNQFLCFQRRTSQDLVIGEHKVMGSAQRRQHNIVWQHGSLLMRKSDHLQTLLGIQDLAPGSMGVQEWIDELKNTYSDVLRDKWGINWQNATEETFLQDEAHEWISNRFGNPLWNERR